MKLISIEIEGYRRFATREVLKTDCQLVALLGPNEAGKTSLLRAIESLNEKTPFKTDGPSRDTTRGKEPADQPIIAATFLLEKPDYEALQKVPGSSEIKRFKVAKYVDGSRYYNNGPALVRDTSVRKSAIKLLRDFLDKDEVEIVSDPSVIENARSVLAAIPDTSVETLPADVIELLKKLMESANRVPSDPGAKAISVELEKTLAVDRVSHPDDQARSILVKRVPRFVFFDDDDRNLRSAYNLGEFFGQGNNNAAIPKALQGLTSTAELDLEVLYKAASSDDQGTVETMMGSANQTLKAKMAQAWNQSDSYVHLRLNGFELKILVGTLRTRFDSITERSDGLRQFVALFGLLSKKVNRQTDIVLLIDEAEHHLHYDAQADLVQMLGKQQLARKVIYTTHSIGCLPEDLGLGVRLVRPIDESERSTIVNKFWSQSATGLSPVLYGIGATTMAFLPVRYCLLVEGPSDMLLLPSLLREAMERETLGFQVAPGLSEANDKQIRVLQREGRRVAFLLDGDEGGNALSEKLIHAGIDNAEIIRLQHSDGGECVIEDFVDANIYAVAINAELERLGAVHRITAGDLPSTQRARAVALWCSGHELQPLSKVDVAYQILNRVSETKIAEAGQVPQLKALHERIENAFKQTLNQA